MEVGRLNLPRKASKFNYKMEMSRAAGASRGTSPNQNGVVPRGEHFEKRRSRREKRERKHSGQARNLGQAM